VSRRHSPVGLVRVLGLFSATASPAGGHSVASTLACGSAVQGGMGGSSCKMALPFPLHPLPGCEFQQIVFT